MYLAKVDVIFDFNCMYSVCVCVYACVCANVRVASQSPLFHKVFF